MTTDHPLSLTAEEFLEFLASLDEIPPCVPVDHYCPNGGVRVKCSGLGCYTREDGLLSEALVFSDGLMLVSKNLWEMMQQ